MGTSHQFLDKKEKEIFSAPLFLGAFSVLDSAVIRFSRTCIQEMDDHLEIWHSAIRRPLPRITFLKALFLLIVFNLSLWGWLNKEALLPIALGMEEKIVVGAENTIPINDLQPESLMGVSAQETLGKEKNPSLSLRQERCQKNKLEGKSSELCGKYEKDEALEKKLAKLDYTERLKKSSSAKKSKKISAPMPLVFAVNGSGQKVCNKSNDKPGKSKKGKGRHMDMECCLDPDEYPNPHCHYSMEKYGKYLK